MRSFMARRVLGSAVYHPGEPREFALAAIARRQRLIDISRERGLKTFDEQPAVCACGRPALFKWKGDGFCRQHKPERIA